MRKFLFFKSFQSIFQFSFIFKTGFSAETPINHNIIVCLITEDGQNAQRFFKFSALSGLK